MGSRHSEFDDYEDDFDAAEKYSGMIKTLRVAMIVAFGATASLGSFGFYFGWNTNRSASQPHSEHGDFQITIVCISFYMVFFGIIGIMAECKASHAFKKFAFLASRLGRGLFLFFVGSIASCMGWHIASELTEPKDYKIFAVGVIDLLVGIFSCLSYCCIRSGQAGEYHARYDELA